MLTSTQTNAFFTPRDSNRLSYDSEAETKKKMATIFQKVENILLSLQQYKDKQSHSQFQQQIQTKYHLTINHVLSMILWKSPKTFQTKEVQTQPRENMSKVGKYEPQRFLTQFSTVQNSTTNLLTESQSKFASTKFVKQICLNSHLKPSWSRIVIQTPNTLSTSKIRKLSLIINKSGKKSEKRQVQTHRQKIKLCKTMKNL